MDLRVGAGAAGAGDGAGVGVDQSISSPGQVLGQGQSMNLDAIAGEREKKREVVGLPGSGGAGWGSSSGPSGRLI